MLSSKDKARAGSPRFLPSTPAAAGTDTSKHAWWEGNEHLTVLAGPNPVYKASWDVPGLGTKMPLGASSPLSPETWAGTREHSNCHVRTPQTTVEMIRGT